MAEQPWGIDRLAFSNDVYHSSSLENLGFKLRLDLTGGLISIHTTASVAFEQNLLKSSLHKVLV